MHVGCADYAWNVCPYILTGRGHAKFRKAPEGIAENVEIMREIPEDPPERMGMMITSSFEPMMYKGRLLARPGKAESVIWREFKPRQTMKPFQPASYDPDPEKNEAILRATSGPGDGTSSELFVNNKYQVLLRHIGHGVIMLSARRLDREAIHDWRELQQIKNMLVGAEREAIEIYPAESRKVDTANQYYLWVLPEGERVAVGFNERMLGSSSVLGSNQRPFDDPEEAAEARRTDDGLEGRFIDHLRAAGVSDEEIMKRMRRADDKARGAK
jgi:hypothetical protein